MSSAENGYRLTTSIDHVYTSIDSPLSRLHNSIRRRRCRVRVYRARHLTIRTNKFGAECFFGSLILCCVIFIFICPITVGGHWDTSDDDLTICLHLCWFLVATCVSWKSSPVNYVMLSAPFCFCLSLVLLSLLQRRMTLLCQWTS